jgi:F420H(2)-dependent biliverdin reductase
VTDPSRPTGADLRSPAMTEFWTQRHLGTLTTLRPSGSPHVVPVGATLDDVEPLVRVITSRTSRKVRNVLAAGPDGAPASICQVEGRHWVTVEGLATVSDDPDEVAQAVRRYALRYREPRPNPERVVVQLRVAHVMGTL